LVLALRHQDGGGHVGELTDGSYKELKALTLSYLQIQGQPMQPMMGALGGTMRQVGWELLKTLDDNIAEADLEEMPDQ
jgi:hypothetical protein